MAGALWSTGVTEPDRAVDDITYLKAMYDYNGGEIKDYFDVQGFHPASAANPPDTKFRKIPATHPAGTTTRRTTSAMSKMSGR